jgi:hypothetical protein
MQNIQKKKGNKAGCQLLTSVILATQEAEIRRIMVQSQPGQIVCKTISQKKKKITKTGLVEWLKVKALSSNSSTTKKKNGNRANNPINKWANELNSSWIK